MIISEEKKVVFIHIPRTGGGTIKTLFGRPDLIHHCAPASMIKAQTPDWDSYYRFSFVRNPFDHRVSAYCFLTQHESGKNYQYPAGLKEGEKFPEWIARKYPDTRPSAGIYRHWLCDESGTLLVNDVFRYEDFEGAVKSLCQKFGIDASQLPHVNESDRGRDYRLYYNDESRRLVEEHFWQDLQDYGYRF